MEQQDRRDDIPDEPMREESLGASEGQCGCHDFRYLRELSAVKTGTVTLTRLVPGKQEPEQQTAEDAKGAVFGDFLQERNNRIRQVGFLVGRHFVLVVCSSSNMNVTGRVSIMDTFSWGEGSINFSAPRVYHNKEGSKKSDVFYFCLERNQFAPCCTCTKFTRRTRGPFLLETIVYTVFSSTDESNMSS